MCKMLQQSFILNTREFMWTSTIIITAAERLQIGPASSKTKSKITKSTANSVSHFLPTYISGTIMRTKLKQKISIAERIQQHQSS